MTKDEVMTMSDNELRIRAAELLGAKTTMPLPAVLTWKQGAIIGQWEDKERGDIWREVPDYPNDIKAAWKLAEKARLSVIWENGEWWVGQTASSLGGDWWFETPVICDAQASRAITRAFILAMEKEER